MEKFEEFRQKFELKMDQLQAELDQLKARLKSATAETKLKYQDEIRALEEQLEKGKTKFNEFIEKGEGAWTDIRDSLVDTLDLLSDKFHDYRKRAQKRDQEPGNSQ